MASSRQSLERVLDQLALLEDVSFRAMMGGVILEVKGKVVGGIYDDRLLVKPTASARRLLPHARLELPYEDGKAMLRVEGVDGPGLLAKLMDAVAGDLPQPKKSKGR